MGFGDIGTILIVLVVVFLAWTFFLQPAARMGSGELLTKFTDQLKKDPGYQKLRAADMKKRPELYK